MAFIVCGLLIPQGLRAEEPENDLAKLQSAIHNFLMEDDGNGDNAKANWQALGVDSPEEENWWPGFANKYFKDGKTLTMNITDYSAPQLHGELILEEIQILESLKLSTVYITKLSINDCQSLKTIDLVCNSLIPGNTTKTSVSIRDCKALSAYGANFYFNAVDDIELSDCPLVEVFYLRSFGDINSITIKDVETLNFINIDITGYNEEESNLGNVSISNTSETLYFNSNYIPITSLPAFSGNITSLRLNCPNVKFDSADLSLLSTVEEIILEGFPFFPKLPSTIKDITYRNYENILSSSINLASFTQLETFDCEYNSLSVITGIPASLKTLNCNYNNLEKLSFIGNTKLETLYCSRNQISELTDLPISLKEIHCDGNKLQKLELSHLVNLNKLDCSYNELTDLTIPDNINVDNVDAFVEVTYNLLPFSVIAAMPHGLSYGYNCNFYYFIQRLTDLGTVTAEVPCDLLTKKIGDKGTCSWYDATELMEEFRERNIEQNSYNGYRDFLQRENVRDVTDDVKMDGETFTISDKLQGRILFCEVSEKDNDNTKPGIYYLMYVEDGGTPLTLKFETMIDDEKEWKTVANNTTTTLSNFNENPESDPESDPGLDLYSDPKPIDRKISMRASVTGNTDTEYNGWKIHYLINTTEPGASGIIEKGDYYIFPDTKIEGQNKNYQGAFAVTKLELFIDGVLGETISYANDPYRHTIIIDKYPILFYEEGINDGKFERIWKNNTTTELDKDNRAFLRMGIKDPGSNKPPIDAMRTEYDPEYNGRYWQIEYFDTEDPDATPIVSPLIQTNMYYDFYDGRAHEESRTYVYSVIRVWMYGDTGPVPVLLKDYPGNRVPVEFTGNPYNHTIIIKGGSGNPDPEPEAKMQFAVAINNNNYKDIPNNHTTMINKGSSVYLRISALVENLSYSSWQIDYTTPTGENVTSDWVPANSPYIFNGGKPHIEKGTYVYTVNRLRVDDGTKIHPFNFIYSPYKSTITINDPDDPNPNPGEKPDPVPGIEISTSSAATTCPNEAYILLPFQLKYTAYPLTYTIHFSEEAKTVGFVDQLTNSPLPENYLTIPLPRNVLAGIYKGTVKMTSKNPDQVIIDCSFEIKVLRGTRITEQPVSVGDLCMEDLFTLSVEATGENLSYQWYRNNQPVNGAIQPILESVFSENTKGTYYVEVKGLCGIEKSKEVLVSGNLLYIQMKWDDFMYIDNTSGRYTAFQWYKDNSPIEKYGKSVYYTNSDGLSGTYFVQATTREGVIETSCNKVFTAQTKSSAAKITPNPVRRNENLIVTLQPSNNKANNTRLDIFDMGGRLVLSQKITEIKTYINISLLEGQYITKVTGPDGRITSQLLIVK